MANFNKVVLLGNTTRAVEVRSIPGSNTAVARTGIAVNRRYKEKDEAMFIDLVAYGKVAEFMGEYVSKGDSILVDGRLSFQTWEQDGQRRTKHEVIIERVQLVGGKKSDSTDNVECEESY